MGQTLILGVVLLCLMSQGASSRGDTPRRDTSRRVFSSWGSFGSHASASGIAVSGPWSVAGSRLVAPLQPVIVQCQEAYMVVTVQRDLFGTGKLIQAADLRLGAAFCKYASLNADNTVTFQIALQDCGNTLQMTPGSLVYSSILTYTPTQSSSRMITRTNQAAVLIQCVYPRNQNVSSKAIKPTWIPFSSTVYSEESLAFSLRLMNDDWSAARTSTTFQLGDVFNIEASVQTGSHAALRIFVDSCVATLNPDKDSSPRYDIITSNGCLVDGKLLDSSSAFIAPRYQIDQLRFSVDAFRFIGDSRSLIYITCNLKAVAASQNPDTMNKACSYSKTSSGWYPVEGPTGICSCCDAGNCGAPGLPSLTGQFWQGRRKRGNVSRPAEAPKVQSAVLGPLEVLQLVGSSNVIEAEVKTKTSRAADKLWMVLSLVASAVVLAFLVLGAAVLHKRCGASTCVKL